MRSLSSGIIIKCHYNDKHFNKQKLQESVANLTPSQPIGQKRCAEDQNEEGGSRKEAKFESDDCKEIESEDCEETKVEGDCEEIKVEGDDCEEMETIEVIDLCDSAEEDCQVLSEGSDENLFRFIANITIFQVQY